MKKILIVLLFVVFALPFEVFAKSPEDIIKQAWLGYRDNGSREQVVWRVEDKKGVRYFAHSIYFSPDGKDGVWSYLFEPKKVKGKGIVMTINPGDFQKSPRYFCRKHSKSGKARRIDLSLQNFSKIDPDINAPWFLTVLQTGAEIFSNSFDYSLLGENSDSWIIKAKAEDLPTRIITIQKSTHFVLKVIVLDKRDREKWIVENVKIFADENRWFPTEMKITNQKNGDVSMVTRDNTGVWKKWPKGYTRRDLSCKKRR